MRRCVFGVVIAFLVAGSVTFGQGQGAAVQERYYSIPLPDYYLGTCDDGSDILGNVLVDVHITTVLDKKTGLPNTAHESDKLWGVYYNSVTLKSVEAGPGLSSQTLYRFDDAGNLVLIEGSALQGKVMVPGHGWIFMETGHVRLTGTWPDFTVLFNSGHNDVLDPDFAVLCAYLQ